MSPDRAAPLPLVALEPPPGTLPGLARPGLAAIAWRRRWWLLLAFVAGGAGGLGLGLMQTVRFTGQASFVVQPMLRPSQSNVAAALPALAGMPSPGSGVIDLHVAILRSRTIAERIIDRFDLVNAWRMGSRTETVARLSRRVNFGMGRREGVVMVSVEDEHPARAAAIANQYIDELRSMLRGFALDEARQRRQYYEQQLVRARASLQEAQQQLQASGYDRAALRSEPRAAADSYARVQAEVAAAEVRLSATRRVRAEDSAEVQQQLAELAALRAQLARMELPKDDAPGSFVSRMREFRYAETLADSIARQTEAARVDETAEAVPLQWLDRAITPEFPSSPRLPLWVAGGAVLAPLALLAALAPLGRRAGGPRPTAVPSDQVP